MACEKDVNKFAPYIVLLFRLYTKIFFDRIIKISKMSDELVEISAALKLLVVNDRMLVNASAERPAQVDGIPADGKQAKITWGGDSHETYKENTKINIFVFIHSNVFVTINFVKS